MPALHRPSRTIDFLTFRFSSHKLYPSKTEHQRIAFTVRATKLKV